jgi:hypothetical protein
MRRADAGKRRESKDGTGFTLNAARCVSCMPLSSRWREQFDTGAADGEAVDHEEQARDAGSLHGARGMRWREGR